MDQTEIVRLGKEAGYTEKALRTAREKLGVTPKKEGFGANGKWVWVPAGGAKVLKLVVDNDKSKKTSSSDKQPRVGADAGGDDMGQDDKPEGGLTPDPHEPERGLNESESGPQEPDGEDAG